jgi:hypothetical protein
MNCSAFRLAAPHKEPVNASWSRSPCGGRPRTDGIVKAGFTQNFGSYSFRGDQVKVAANNLIGIARSRQLA